MKRNNKMCKMFGSKTFSSDNVNRIFSFTKSTNRNICAYMHECEYIMYKMSA